MNKLIISAVYLVNDIVSENKDTFKQTEILDIISKQKALCIEEDFKALRDLIDALEKHYHTNNGLAFKDGMIHMYNLFVHEILGKDGEDLKYER